MTAPNRRQMMAVAAAGAIVLATGIGTAKARRRFHTGAWYVREFEKICAYPTAAFFSDGREPDLWFLMGTFPNIGLRGDNCHDRFGELKAMIRSDPNGWDKLVRHCGKSGRCQWWGAS